MRKLSPSQIIEIKKQLGVIELTQGENQYATIITEIYLNQIYQKLGYAFIPHLLKYEHEQLVKQFNHLPVTFENLVLYSYQDLNKLYSL